jgi:hypothetical protein
MKIPSSNGSETHKAVLLLAYWYPPENTSGAARPYRFVRYLPQFGIQPRTLAAAFEDEPPLVDSVQRTPALDSPFADRLCSRIARLTQRFLLPYNDQLQWVPHAIAAGLRSWEREPFDAVFSTSPPLATHMAAMELKRRLGIRWVADFRDPLLDNPFRNRQWAFPYDAIVERQILGTADAVVANTEGMAEIWRIRYPQWSPKIHVIWNGYDPADDVAPAPIETRPYRVIAHVGTLYGGRHPAALLASLERLIATGSLCAETIRVQLTGPIENGLMERHCAAFESLTKRGILQYDGRLVPPAEARRVLSTSEYLLLLDLNECDTGLQVPAKLFEYIRIGRPILVFTARYSQVHRIVETSGIPHRFVFTGTPAVEIDRQVLSFVQLPTNPMEPSDCFRNQFDCIPQTAALARLLLG